jgi:hypothetical protein
MLADKFTKESLVDKIDTDGIANFLLFGFDKDEFEGTPVEYLIEPFTAAKEALEEAVALYEKIDEEVSQADYEEFGDNEDEEYWAGNEDDGA